MSAGLSEGVKGRLEKGERSPRLAILVTLLIVCGAAYFATAPFRSRLNSRIAEHRQQQQVAAQIRAASLEGRQIRADLRDALRGLAADPFDFDRLLRAASLYGQLRQYDDALFMLDEARRIRPRAVEVYRAYGQIYLAQGFYDRAQEKLEEGLRFHPDDVELNLTLTHISVVVAWWKEALPRVRRLFARWGDREPRIHLMAALLARTSTETAKMEQHLRRAAELDAKNDKVWALLSGADWEVGRPEPARQHILRALQLNPSEPAYWLQLGQILRASRVPAQVRQAEEVYRRVLQMAPDSEQARLGIAKCRLELGDEAEAQRLLEEHQRARPGNPSVLLELGKLYARQGREKEARPLLDAYRRAGQLNTRKKNLSFRMVMLPKDPTAYLEMGRFELEAGSPHRAVLILRRGLKYAPQEKRLKQALREALIQGGRAYDVPELVDGVRRPRE